MKTLIEKLENRLYSLRKKQRFEEDECFALEYKDNANGFEQALNIIKQHSNWVSISESLPAKLQRVLVCFKEKGIISGTWFGGEEGYFQSDNGLSDWYALADNTMEFWQPLPQPPSEVQNG